MSISTTETMTTLRDATICKISQLSQINRDSAAGFQEAAEAVEDKTLAADFRVWAVDRTRQADELQAVAEQNGEQAPEDRSWSAAAHQTWMNFRASLSGGDAYTVLAEAERGEDAIKQKYEEVLKEVAGSAATTLLQGQYAKTKAVHDRVRDLRDARKK